MEHESDLSSLAAIRDCLANILPADAGIAVWGLDTQEVSIFQEEREAVARAVEPRRQEFARGRACARAALRSLGVGPVPLRVGPGRQPVWPSGTVGSITHGAGVVAAVAARVRDLCAIGVDVEGLEPLPRSIRDMVVQPEDHPPEEKQGAEKVLFSGKESVFKALYPRHELWMDFDGVALGPGPERFTLRARRTGRSPAPSDLDELFGGYGIVAGRVITAFWKPASNLDGG